MDSPLKNFTEFYMSGPSHEKVFLSDSVSRALENGGLTEKEIVRGLMSFAGQACVCADPQECQSKSEWDFYPTKFGSTLAYHRIGNRIEISLQ